MILDTGWSGAEIPLLRGYWMLVTGCWMQDTDYRLPITDYWILAGAERKIPACGRQAAFAERPVTDYRLPDAGMLKFLYPVSPQGRDFLSAPTSIQYLF